MVSKCHKQNEAINCANATYTQDKNSPPPPRIPKAQTPAGSCTQSASASRTQGGQSMATAPRARRLAAADVQPATPAVGPASGGRPQFNLSSGAATAVVFVSIVLCFILLCTYCRCARQRAIAGARSRVMREIRERVPGVLLLRPAAAAAALPVLPYSAAAAAAGAKKGPLVEDCPVCLEAFAGDDGVKVVPACGHVFHAACIDQWLAVRNSCPVCRCAVVCYYADRARDTAVVVDDDDDDQEVVLERVVAMIEAIREEQREEEAAARRAPASDGGGGEGLMTS
ncbi:probable E3 ubiquitin-protein ligase ATL45 [Oryza sativa Japonica Group]|uniref:RING-type E3 ubiquitin transferase n=2 Tax=Oryza sativa subsp. japonica TaxID=39947 RepID=A0A0P0XWX4_ORYSJ|nr:probable E3 ubiquitin-protein ligase ATL45 [Oryza sativa Japonica Group]KAB8113552.1 hypothetical protein EE612_052601 [Oryza sativa]BAT11911.1 Os10g0546900 [Oryza sativa Japonica Group]